jgi:putative transposase
MLSSNRRDYFQSLLLTSLQEAGVDVVGWVILTNHYHLLVEVESLNTISAVFNRVHGITSRMWNREDNLTGNRRTWYRFYDRAIRNENHFYAALNYIHINPLKHSLVSNVIDWPWSSLRIYYDEFGVDWLKRKWSAFPPSGIRESMDFLYGDS